MASKHHFGGNSRGYGPTVQVNMSAVAEPNPMRKSDQRFRSFAERYVIARAETFRPGHEADDGHACILMARTIYKMTKEVGRTIDETGET